MLCRPAEPADFRALADMRWRLKMEDAPTTDAAAYDAFVAAFVDWAGRDGAYVHWVAEDQGRLLGAMSVAQVRKPPAPDEPDGCWGYLTNAYVYPDARNAGAGRALLAQIIAWARADGLELLIVWPSEPAYPFYERAGFARGRDPLMLEL